MAYNTSQKLEIDWLKTAGGALAAVSSAFLLSTFGAAGTIIGAALGSVIVTVGGALYSQGLARSHQRLAQVQVAAMRKVGDAQAEVRQAARHPGDGETVDAHLAHAGERLRGVKDDLGTMANEPTGPGWRERLVVLPWKRISLIAAGLFAAAVRDCCRPAPLVDHRRHRRRRRPHDQPHWRRIRWGHFTGRQPGPAGRPVFTVRYTFGRALRPARADERASQ
jgi:hypothetical protein